MTVVLGTPYSAPGSLLTHTVTVPPGVTTQMTGLIALTTATKSSATLAGVKANGTAVAFRVIDSRLFGNGWVVVATVSGVSAGQSLAVTLGQRTQIFAHHFYQDEFTFPATAAGIGTRPASSATTTSGTLTPSVGDTVAVLGVERSMTAGTVVTSVQSSAGEAISTIGFAEATANPDGSVYFGRFTATAASKHTATIKYNTASGNGYAALIPTVSTTPPPPTPPAKVAPPAVQGAGDPITVTLADGVKVSGSAYYVTASGGLATPAEVRTVPSGYPSVAAMLATPQFAVAHRGGSLDWPEMSLHAYTQSVFWGVGALEVSLARSKDGVWFGLHDQTLDRVAGTSDFVAAAHTWAEIQQYLILAAGTTNPNQSAQPFMRWEQLIAAYYGTHVLFVDPKYAVAYRSELLDLMDALPGTPTSSIVAKYYGVSSAWPVAARARGYQTWGYFYQADVPNIAAYQGQYDILGMDYTADADAWTAISSYGKPVIGHIIPSAAGLTRALGFGAAGCMVSGVKEAVTRSA